jgi:hypothetical protein
MIQADNSIWCWGKDVYGNLGKGGGPNAFAPLAATEFNTGSANIQLVASWLNTYVDLYFCP